MKQLCMTRSGEVIHADVPCPAIREGHVMIRTAFSTVSPGTELAGYHRGGILKDVTEDGSRITKALNMLATRGVSQTVDVIRERLNALIPIGYSAAGVVVEVGENVSGISKGDWVACMGHPHAEMMLVPKNLVARIPRGVLPQHAAAGAMACIAMHAVRLAQLELGASALVVGLGAIGNMVVQFLRASGVNTIGADLDAHRVDLAMASGLDVGVLNPAEMRRAVMSATEGRGADAVLLCAGSSSSEPTNSALECAADRARIIMVGGMGLALERGPLFTRELTFQVSRSYGPGRYDMNYEEKGHDYPVGYVRWTEQRNLLAVLDLLHRGDLKLSGLTDEEVPFGKAAEAFAALAERKTNALSIVLSYPTEASQDQALCTVVPKPKRISTRKFLSSVERPRVALVGAGAFARSTLIHAIVSAGGQIASVLTATPLSASETAKRWAGCKATTNYEDVLRDPDIGLVVISTRHNLHFAQAKAALQAGKFVHVEKPMTMTASDARELVSLHSSVSTFLTVGYNRRFAPMVEELRSYMAGRVGPVHAIYRVNAGRLPQNHWVYDPIQGGGRLIGEGCHFIDLLVYLIASPLLGVKFVPSAESKGRAEDDFMLNMSFVDGSLATLLYSSRGDSRVPKEWLEFHWDGRYARMEDYRKLESSGRRSRRSWSVDKGFTGHFKDVFEAIRVGRLPRTTAESGLLVAEIIEMARAQYAESASQRPVGAAT